MATHAHLNCTTFTKGLPLTIYPAENQASSSRDDTKRTRYSSYTSNGWVEPTNFETLLRILKLMVSGRNRGKSSLANCQLHKDKFAFPFISCSWQGQTTGRQRCVPQRRTAFLTLIRYNLLAKETAANMARTGNVQKDCSLIQTICCSPRTVVTIKDYGRLQSAQEIGLAHLPEVTDLIWVTSERACWPSFFGLW